MNNELHPVHWMWGLLRVCAACPTARLNLRFELRPSQNNMHVTFTPEPRRIQHVFHEIREYFELLNDFCQIKLGISCIVVVIAFLRNNL